MTEPVRYSDSITVRCQPELNQLVDRAARSRGMKPAEYVRQGVQTALRLDGFDPAAIAPRDAGALYDAIDGQRCYALVSGDRIVTDTPRLGHKPNLADASYHPAGYVPSDGDAWLPIVHEDSEPFDIGLHWRLAPIVRIEADRVVREYPVVPKSWAVA